MKATIAILIGLGLCVQARSATLTTVQGTTYNNITEQRVDPDGLYIEYTLPGGGVGMSKVKFSRLSAEQQKQFGYEADKAKDFETGVAKATEDWRQESIRMDQAAREAREARESRDEKAANERMLAMAQLTQAQAELARASAGNEAGGGGWYLGGGGYGLTALPRLSGPLNSRDPRLARNARNQFQANDRSRPVRATTSSSPLRPLQIAP